VDFVDHGASGVGLKFYLLNTIAAMIRANGSVPTLATVEGAAKISASAQEKSARC
jgi:hypothetical protein